MNATATTQAITIPVMAPTYNGLSIFLDAANMSEIVTFSNRHVVIIAFLSPSLEC